MFTLLNKLSETLDNLSKEKLETKYFGDRWSNTPNRVSGNLEIR
jgi:hypothetical protein